MSDVDHVPLNPEPTEPPVCYPAPQPGCVYGPPNFGGGGPTKDEICSTGTANEMNGCEPVGGQNPGPSDPPDVGGDGTGSPPAGVIVTPPPADRGPQIDIEVPDLGICINGATENGFVACNERVEGPEPLTVVEVQTAPPAVISAPVSDKDGPDAVGSIIIFLNCLFRAMTNW